MHAVAVCGMTDDGGRACRRTMVNVVLAGMKKAGYDIPPETLDLFRRWISSPEQVTPREILEATAPYLTLISRRESG